MNPCIWSPAHGKPYGTWHKQRNAFMYFLWSQRGYKMRDLVKRFGISASAVQRLVHREDRRTAFRMNRLADSLEKIEDRWRFMAAEAPWLLEFFKHRGYRVVTHER